MQDDITVCRSLLCAFRSDDDSAQTVADLAQQLQHAAQLGSDLEALPEVAQPAAGECSRTMDRSTWNAAAVQRRRRRTLIISHEAQLAAAYAASQHCFKPVKLSLDRTSKRKASL